MPTSVIVVQWEDETRSPVAMRAVAYAVVDAQEGLKLQGIASEVKIHHDAMAVPLRHLKGVLQYLQMLSDSRADLVTLKALIDELKFQIEAS